MNKTQPPDVQRALENLAGFSDTVSVLADTVSKGEQQCGDLKFCDCYAETLPSGLYLDFVHRRLCGFTGLFADLPNVDTFHYTR
jgi:hypothetical protein